MSHCFFASAVLPFLVVMMCCGSGVATAGGREPQTIRLFTRRYPVTHEEISAVAEGKSTYAVDGHSLVFAKGVMIAFAKARSGSDSISDVDFWAKCIRREGSGEGSWVSVTAAEKNGAGGKNVGTEANQSDVVVYRYGPRAIVKDDKIFLLLMKYTIPKKPSFRVQRSMSYVKNSETTLEVVLHVGTVTNSAGTAPSVTWESSKKSNSWADFTPSTTNLRSVMETNALKFSLDSTGRGIVHGGTIVFPLVLLRGEETTRVCTVIYSTDNGASWKLTSSGAVVGSCVDATLLVWNNKILMIATAEQGYYRLYESSDVGVTWRETTRTHSYLLGDTLYALGPSDGDDIITANIDGSNVMLFTMRSYSYDEATKTIHSVLHLWITDGERMHPVGPISVEKIQHHVFSALLYADNMLFAMYEGRNHTSSNIFLANLNEQLGRIKTVLTTWKEVHTKVSRLCSPPDATGGPSGLACNPPVPTTGLVGFLSNRGNATHWDDEYLGMSAFVNGATKVQNGFHLRGSASRILWPMIEQGGNVLYSFAERGLTLVAMVTIHKAPKGPIPLLGVGTSVGEQMQEVSLCYDEKKHWRACSSGERVASAPAWKKGETYQVAVTIQNVTGSAYIDGQRVGALEGTPVPNARRGSMSNMDVGVAEWMLPRARGEVSYVFFGDKAHGADGAGNDLTVSDVFLYNRLLNDEELRALNNVGAALKKRVKRDGSVRVGALWVLLLLGLCGFAAFF